eukprot:TRINITY_DN42068_c0_g1_i1.p1 TRINITY_DN42068_c0_g1~~TRINITY_DN42068_c0_g1_i1.p1  ORF type:complete len:511 (+),score=52.39 TRINITY_DN42068_c0_g1_i1:40-1572(+)
MSAWTLRDIERKFAALDARAVRVKEYYAPCKNPSKKHHRFADFIVQDRQMFDKDDDMMFDIYTRHNAANHPSDAEGAALRASIVRLNAVSETLEETPAAGDLQIDPKGYRVLRQVTLSASRNRSDIATGVTNRKVALQRAMHQYLSSSFSTLDDPHHSVQQSEEVSLPSPFKRVAKVKLVEDATEEEFAQLEAEEGPVVFDELFKDSLYAQENRRASSIAPTMWANTARAESIPAVTAQLAPHSPVSPDRLANVSFGSAAVSMLETAGKPLPEEPSEDPVPASPWSRYVNSKAPRFHERERLRFVQQLRSRAHSATRTPKISRPTSAQILARDLSSFLPPTFGTDGLYLPTNASMVTLPGAPQRVSSAGRPRTAGVQHSSVPALPQSTSSLSNAKTDGDQMRHAKHFYFLHVRIQSASAQALAAWRFDVTVTDLSDPAKPSHTFPERRVNDTLHIVFHEPNTCVLSPVDDLPWVREVDQLYGHTVRLEVVAVYPNRTKVVDTTVHYGPAE